LGKNDGRTEFIECDLGDMWAVKKERQTRFEKTQRDLIF